MASRFACANLRGILALLVATAAVVGGAAARRQSAAAMADAASRFLAALTPEQREKATFAFADDQRLDWHFIPRLRKGVPLKELDPRQRELAAAFLRTGLSQHGYLKATTIMEIETILGKLEALARAARPSSSPAQVRDPDLYYFSVFGAPSAEQPWSWRVEGHHLSLNFTVVNGAMVATTPSFFGANPAEVREGPRQGLRALGSEEDLARELLLALDEQQRREAIFDATAPRDIITMNANRIDPLAPAGIRASRLTTPQKQWLRRLLDEYAGAMPPDLAAERMKKLERAGFDKIAFAWAGSRERGQPHYYRVQGPTFLIEYDNTQNDANHIHTVWRDFEGDFGRDLLREHYRRSQHQP